MDCEIQNILRQLGIGRNYCGYQCAFHSLMLILENENALSCVKHNILEPVGNIVNRGWKMVERNLRTVTHRAWATNSSLLISMAGYPLTRVPTTTEFLEIVSGSLIRQMKDRQ